MTTQDAVRAYLADCKARNLSPKTLSNYAWAISKLQAAFPDLPTTPDPLIALLASQQLAHESRYDLWRQLATFYTWAAHRYSIPNPMTEIRRPQRGQNLPRTLERWEIERLLSSISDPRDLAMVALILDTGMRLSELAALRWPHIGRDRILIVRGKGSRQRYVPISPEVRRLLDGHGDGFYVWVSYQPGHREGRPLTSSGVLQAIKRVLRNGGFRPPKAGPHMLRHTFGRHYIKNGGDVFSLQRIMGHQDVSTTMIYVYLNDADVAAQHAKASPMRGFMAELHKGGGDES